MSASDKSLDFINGIKMNIVCGNIIIHAQIICEYDMKSEELIFYSCCEERHLFDIICPCEGDSLEESISNLMQELALSEEFQSYNNKH